MILFSCKIDLILNEECISNYVVVEIKDFLYSSSVGNLKKGG